MKWNEAMKRLNIGRNKFFKFSKQIFTEKKINYSEEDINKIIKLLQDTEIPKADENNIEPIGDNQYYAKLLMQGELYSVGAFSSTDLEIDTKRFKNAGLTLEIITYEEANKLYKMLNYIKDKDLRDNFIDEY
jgi:hypothetical protein